MLTRHLLIFVTAVSLSAFASPAPDPPLPTAKQIVERYDQALGGRDAITRHTSCTLKGSTEIPQPAGSMNLAFVYYAAAPYRRLEKTTLPNGAGDVFNGFDGDHAWSLDPRAGPAVYDGNERESMKRDADFYYALNELSWFKSMQTIGVEDFEGRACYRLHGINNWDKSNDHFYDRETGLLAGYEFNSDLGPTHEIFTDYKKIDGVLVPTRQIVKVKTKDGNWVVAQTLTFEAITFNDVDPAVFTPPESVRKLIDHPAPAKK
ncbi:MAG TPA: hypothetical protein VLX60_16010 [Terriglobales bacterium]|nr:hypothetical protein [Terriglobales bacterium]